MSAASCARRRGRIRASAAENDVDRGAGAFASEMDLRAKQRDQSVVVLHALPRPAPVDGAAGQPRKRLAGGGRAHVIGEEACARDERIGAEPSRVGDDEIEARP
jgi:hypothetical protein